MAWTFPRPSCHGSPRPALMWATAHSCSRGLLHRPALQPPSLPSPRRTPRCFLVPLGPPHRILHSRLRNRGRAAPTTASGHLPLRLRQALLAGRGRPQHPLPVARTLGLRHPRDRSNRRPACKALPPQWVHVVRSRQAVAWTRAAAAERSSGTRKAAGLKPILVLAGHLPVPPPPALSHI